MPWALIVVGAASAVGQSVPLTRVAEVDSNGDAPVNQRQREAEYASLSRDVEALERELGLVKRVVKLVTPTVVHVESRPLGGSIQQLQIEEEGSGVVVKFGAQHYVLTNRHVIRHATTSNIRVQLADGRTVRPKQKWTDPETDVAVMSIDEPRLVAARIGDSERLEIGEYVLAVGSPFGLSQSVSAKGRYDLELGDGELQYMDFIQTDAAINPGNSGGPLVNLRGEVVGLNTAIASASGGNEGIGFTIPINVVVQIAQELVQNREPPRGFLGVKLEHDFNEASARAIGMQRLMGTRVTEVEPRSPAEEAGLQVGDVIVLYDGMRVERDEHLISRVKLTPIGRDVELLLIRDGEPVRKSVTIGDLRGFMLAQP
jgi:serine protease Do